jgi:hypothetical protein
VTQYQQRLARNAILRRQKVLSKDIELVFRAAIHCEKSLREPAQLIRPVRDAETATEAAWGRVEAWLEKYRAVFGQEWTAPPSA